MSDHWQYFNVPNIMSEAKARLAQAREHPTKLTRETDTLEYWCAWCAHANAVACLTATDIEQLRAGLQEAIAIAKGTELTRDALERLKELEAVTIPQSGGK